VSGIQQAIMAGGYDIIRISDQSLTDPVIGSPSSVAYNLTNTGKAQKFALNNGGTTDLENWTVPQLNMALYTARAHVNSGTSPSGDALDSDLALSSTRSWGLTQSVVGTKTCVLLVTIKRASDGVTMDTALITLTATES
jgi:hypothetical protein